MVAIVPGAYSSSIAIRCDERRVELGKAKKKQAK